MQDMSGLETQATVERMRVLREQDSHPIWEPDSMNKARDDSYAYIIVNSSCPPMP